MSELLDHFDHLTALPNVTGEGEFFCGSPLLNSDTRHLAKDAEGRPAVLFRVPYGPANRRLVGMALENLHVEHDIACRIADGRGHVITGQFSIIRCLSPTRELQEYFLNALDGIIRSIPDPATGSEIAAVVSNLVALFHALRQPASRSAIGLWAEMFLICRSRKPKVLMQAWHADVMERYDFSLDDQRVEAKASSDRSRRHHFSLEQAHPPAAVTVIVASLYVEQCTQGISLGDLWDRLRTIAAGDLALILKVERLCIEALGDAWRTSLSRAYDWALADESLSFYSIDAIPRVSASQPMGVDDIRFRSDLSLAQPMPPADLHGIGRLLDAMLGSGLSGD